LANEPSSDGSTKTVVKVLDFGIAKVGPHHDEKSVDTLPSPAGLMRTMGTPSYMAPEQGLEQGDVDARADIWAFGAILFECLSGNRLHGGGTVGQMLGAVMARDFPALKRLPAALPADVTELMRAMLERDPAKRPRDLSDVAAA